MSFRLALSVTLAGSEKMKWNGIRVMKWPESMLETGREENSMTFFVSLRNRNAGMALIQEPNNKRNSGFGQPSVAKSHCQQGQLLVHESTQVCPPLGPLVGHSRIVR